MIPRVVATLVLLALTGCSGRTIEVRDAVVVVPIGDVTAAYLSIENHGEAPDQLIGVWASEGTAELHRSFEDGGLMHMEQVELVEVAPGEVVVFEPGGLHIMLFGVAGLESQDSVQLILEFAREGTVEVMAPLRTYAELVP